MLLYQVSFRPRSAWRQTPEYAATNLVCRRAIEIFISRHAKALLDQPQARTRASQAIEFDPPRRYTATERKISHYRERSTIRWADE
jgi:hypothetical protein